MNKLTFNRNFGFQIVWIALGLRFYLFIFLVFTHGFFGIVVWFIGIFLAFIVGIRIVICAAHIVTGADENQQPVK